MRKHDALCEEHDALCDKYDDLDYASNVLFMNHDDLQAEHDVLREGFSDLFNQHNISQKRLEQLKIQVAEVSHILYN